MFSKEPVVTELAVEKTGITVHEMMQEAAKAGITSTETIGEYRRA